MSILYKKHGLYPDSILIRKFVGKVSVDDIIESWEYLQKNKLIDDKIKGLINDLTGCELLLDMNCFSTLMIYMKSQDFIRAIKIAVICDTPQKIVFPVMGEKHHSELKIKPFSTLEAAVHWINLDY